MASSRQRVDELEQRVSELDNQLAQVNRIQTSALRRIHLLPDNVRELIDAESIGAATLTDDGQGMTYLVGGAISLTIRPYAEKFELADQAGRNAPLTIPFGAQSDFDREKVLAILGYAALTKRDGNAETGADWVRRLNGTPAKV